MPGAGLGASEPSLWENLGGGWSLMAGGWLLGDAWLAQSVVSDEP